MQRLCEIHPDKKISEDAINAKRLICQAEWQRLIDHGDTDTAKRFGDFHAKELQNDASYSRGQIVADLQLRISAIANNRNFDLVLDVSRKSTNGTPVVIQASDLPDLTDEIIRGLIP